jgi:DNA-binding MarR family transcriptional regulator
MSDQKAILVATPCMCNALRQASRAVTRLYDEEMRGIGLRATQYSLLRLLHRLGEIRQGDLGPLVVLDETTVTRTLRPLMDHRWVAVRDGRDRRERLVSITVAGRAKLAEARPAWQRAQQRLRTSLPKGAWENLMSVLPEVAQCTAET